MTVSHGPNMETVWWEVVHWILESEGVYCLYRGPDRRADVVWMVTSQVDYELEWCQLLRYEDVNGRVIVRTAASWSRRCYEDGMVNSVNALNRKPRI